METIGGQLDKRGNVTVPLNTRRICRFFSSERATIGRVGVKVLGPWAKGYAWYGTECGQGKSSYF